LPAVFHVLTHVKVAVQDVTLYRNRTITRTLRGVAMYMNLGAGRVKAGMWSEYEHAFLQANAQALDLPGLVCR
jgi:hypothetical protein